MSFVTFLPAALAVGICLIPAWLLRGQATATRTRRLCVGAPATRPEVVRNASIASALRMVALGPLFAWGANGDWQPAAVVVISFALGVWLIHALREPLIAFVDDALRAGGSVTVHAFVAYRLGGDPRVRRLAASLTIVALAGLLVAEAAVVTLFLEPMLPDRGVLVGLCIAGALLLAALHASAGHSAVMHSAQWRLGMLLLGLFGSMTLLLYVHVSARADLPPHGTLAIAATAAWCALLLVVRRSRYVDSASSSRVLTRFGKTLNAFLSVLLALILVMALMDLYGVGGTVVIRETMEALTSRTRVPTLALIALCAWAMLYPLVDVTNWQRLAALRNDAEAGSDPGRRSEILGRVFGACARDSALLMVFVWLLGALAATASGTDSLARLLAGLSRGDGEAAIALPLLVLAVAAAALTTMTALCSAAACTVDCDLAPPGKRGALAAGGAILLAAAAGVWVTSEPSRYFAPLLIASCCVQLSFAPLVLGASPTRRPGSAIVTLLAGAVAGLTAVIVYLVTGTEAWLWSAVPACLAAGWLLSLLGRTSRRT